MIQVSALIGYIHAVIQYYYVTYVCVCVCVCVCTCVYMCVCVCVCFIIFSSKCSSFSTEIKQFIHGNHGRLSLHTSLLGKCGSSLFFTITLFNLVSSRLLPVVLILVPFLSLYSTYSINRDVNTCSCW